MEVTPEEGSGDNETTELLTTTEENLGTSPTEAPKDAPESATVVVETTTETEGLITDEALTTLPAAIVSSTNSASSTSSSTTTTPTTSVSSTTLSTTSTSSVAPPVLVTDSSIGDVEKEEEDILDILKLLETTFKAYEPSSDYFTSIPSMEDITLSCDVIIAAR